MDPITVGLIPSPDLPKKIVQTIVEELKKDLREHVDQQTDWQIEIRVNSFIGAAEYVNEGVDRAVSMKEELGWDYAICITDLPSISNYKVVIADVSTNRGAALISLPSFGAFPLKKRIRKALTYIIELLYKNDERDQEQKTEAQMNWRFLLSKVEQVTPKEEDESTDSRYVINSYVFGWLRILSGMVFANRPWMALTSFKKILTLAFATGTYISIFSTPWALSVAYSIPRFVILMIISILGMVTWITFAHKLWEKPTSKSQSQYRKLYNLTTVMTLVSITLINYIVLFCLFMISISLFVPEGLFEAWTHGETGNSIGNFVRLAWLITSLGLLAGAVGATAEKEERVRHITYSYRQLHRYYSVQQAEKEKKTSDEATEQSYNRTHQTHREIDK